MPRKCVDIRGQVGMDFRFVAFDEGEEDSEFIKLIGGKTEGGIGRRLKNMREEGRYILDPMYFGIKLTEEEEF